jgi:hypothetical protein
MRVRAASRMVRVMGVVAFVASLGACAGPWPVRGGAASEGADQRGAIVVETLGDWEDVEASVLLAASQSECAMEGFSLVNGEEAWAGEIVSVHDDRAGVRVMRVALPDGAREGAAGVRMEVLPAATSDRGVLTRFGEHFRRRMRQLRGVRVAPVDGVER